jgi:hypothetical protein
MAEQSLARTQADTYAANSRVDPTEIRDLLRRIHEALLLPDDERVKRFRLLMEQEFAERLAAVDQSIDTYDFHRAREELASLAERFGANNQQIQDAHARLQKASDAARADDVARITRRIEDLMDLAQWEEAEKTARALVDRYPIAPEPATLLERVRRERNLFEQKNRHRMQEEIQQHVHARRWQEALAAALTFVHTFPEGPDSDAIRQQMETLEANADIQARQSLERRLKQHVVDRQYWDALALARRIITEHPLSPQANALRGQIPRLEELARRQGART